MTERVRAEHAMDVRAAHTDGPDKPKWPPAAERIRNARLQVGLTENEVAKRLGMTIDAYWDLEHHDDEAFTVAPLHVLTELGRTLKVEPRFLLLGSETEGLMQSITFKDISARLIDQITKAQISAEQFGDAMGWDVTALVTDPQVLGTYDVEAVYNITKALGLDWVAALPSISTSQ